jgi:hypothetical protein
MHSSIANAHYTIFAVIGLIATVALVKVLVGMIAKQKYGRVTQSIMLLYSGAILLQWLTGIAFFASLDKWSDGDLWGHAIAMTSAALVALLPFRWQHLDDAMRYRRALLVLTGVLLLVITGLLFLPLLVELAALLLVLGGVRLLFRLDDRRFKPHSLG